MSTTVVSPPAPASDTVHDVFISYSRRDRAFARAFADALRGYRPPKDLAVPQRPLNIFRDEEDFTGVEYHRAVDRHLRESARLVVICSPQARRSEYVNDEIRRFAAARGVEAIVPILLAGVPNNEAGPSQGDDMAFPEALCELLAMPLAIDYRGFAAGKDKMSAGAFHAQWYATLAAVYALPRHQIEQREKRREARRRRVTRAIVGGVIAVLFAATIVSLVFWRQAVDERTVAEARQLAAVAELARSQAPSQIETSVLLAAESLTRVPTLEAELVLRPQLRLLARSAELRSGAWVMAFSPDGRYAVAEVDEGLVVMELPGGRTVATLAPVQPCMRAVFSADGRRLATGSGAIMSPRDANVAQVWDLSTGTELARLRHDDPVFAVDLSADGRLLATADAQRARVWEVATGRAVVDAAHDATLLTIDVSPDGNRLATHVNKWFSRIWNVGANALEAGTRPQPGRLAVAFSPDWSLMASADESGIRIAEAPGGRELARINELDVGQPRFVAGGEWLLATARRDTIIWEARTGDEIARLENAAGAAAVSPDRRLIAVVSGDDLVQVWATAQGEVHRLYHRGVDTVAFTPDSQHLVTGSRVADNIRVWRASGDGEVATFVHGRAVSGVAYTRDGRYLITNSDDRFLRVLDARAGTEVARIRTEYGVRSFAVSPADNRTLVVAHERRTYLYDASTRAERVPLPMDEGVNIVLFSPDGQRIATAGLDNVLRVWDPSGRRIATMPTGDGIASMAFGPDGEYVAASSINTDTATIWKTATGEEVAVIRKEGALHAVQFSPDGRTMAAASSQIEQGVVLLFDARTGEERRRLPHAGVSEVLAFSPDGAQLVSAGGDGTVIVWTVSNGAAVKLPHRGQVTGMVFDADGRRLFTASVDGAVRAWDAASGRELSRIETGGPVLSLALHPNGRRVVSGEGGLARVWYTEAGELVAETCQRVTRNLTAAEWGLFVGSGTPSKTCPGLPDAP